MPDSPIAARSREGRAPRLLMVHSSSDRYGSDLALLRIATAATEQGWHVDVVLPAAGPLAADLASAGIEVTLLETMVLRRADMRLPGALTLPYRLARSAAALRRFQRSRSAYDVIHSNCAPTLGGAVLAVRRSVRHVWYVHEIFPSSTQRTIVGWLLVRSSDLVFACSGAVLAQFPGVSKRGIGRVAYTGVDVPADIPVVEPMSRPGPPVVVCVGRLNSWKGQEVLVDAVALLRGRGTVVNVELVGSVFRDERHFETALRHRISELGLGAQVTLLGERPDALAIVGRADVAVVPSTRPEPFGMALVEAMALARPVVATRAGGPAEVVSDGVDGILVPPGDARALADALQRVVGDGDFARELGAHAKRRAADFTSKAMTEQLVAAYDALLLKGTR